MTPEEKQQAFHTELKALLAKFNAELTIENFGRSWGWGNDDKIVVDFDWDEEMSDKHGTGIIPQLVLGTFEDGRD
jgi:hypothetical protein